MYAVLLAGAVAVLVAAEWPRLAVRFGLDAHARREPRRARKRGHLRLGDDDADAPDDDFAASVQRDLERLPTIDERDRT